MTTQEQVITALTEVYWGVEGSREKDYAYDTVEAFINEHPDPEPPKPTVDEMLEVLDVNMPYLREEMEAVFQVYYGIPVYVTVS